MLCIFGACHDLPWGALTIVDRRRGLDGSEPVTRIWPASARGMLENQQNAAWTPNNIDLFRRVRPKYEDPYPLSDKYFLVSRSVGEVVDHYGQREGNSARMAIFLVDVFGNELLLHDEAPGCYDPMPIVAREQPPAIPPRIDLARNEGQYYLYDVYHGTGMERVPRGTIKYLRIIEAPDKLFWNERGWVIDATQVPAMNWNLTNNKRIIGDVPVEPDGSAYFTVPSGTFVYFQALDERKMMVQSMRSGTFVQPGETTGCVGCHEHRLTSAPSHPRAAFSREPSRPQPWFGPPREFNYLTEVQSVWDRHCVECHDHGKEAGEVLNLAGDQTLLFNVSYTELHRKSALRWSPDEPGAEKRLINAVHDGPPETLPPYAWGSHRSRLIDVLLEGHEGVQLDDEDFQRIVTWIDLNTPYYGSYASAYRQNAFGRSPLDDEQLARLGELTGQLVGDAQTMRSGWQVNLARPEWSPVLAELRREAGADYDEALAIIRSGRQRLIERQRADMQGFRLTAEHDLDRRKRHDAWSRTEAQMRAAIAGGEKQYEDSPDGP